MASKRKTVKKSDSKKVPDIFSVYQVDTDDIDEVDVNELKVELPNPPTPGKRQPVKSPTGIVKVKPTRRQIQPRMDSGSPIQRQKKKQNQ